jgi:hypothetical protein
MKNRTLAAAVVGTGTVVASTLALTAPGQAAGDHHADRAHHQHAHHHANEVDGRLDPLNNSGVTGRAMITVRGRHLKVRYHASRLAPGLPHAVHIHYGQEAMHECPTVARDTNHDFRLNVAEGLPDYGPIVKSLTTRGSTSPASALAVDRFPTAPDGVINYHRLVFAKKAVARAVRRGEGVLVIHGVDYNNNGKYDFRSAGRSEIDKTLPAEATDPAACGVLR